MHGANLVEILTDLTKATKISSVEEPEGDVRVGNEGVGLDLVEHILLVQGWVEFAGVEPEVVEGNGSRVRLGVDEASVWEVACV